MTKEEQLSKAIASQTEKLEEQKPKSTKIWFYVSFAGAIILLLFLAIFKVISWGWFSGISVVIMVVFFVILLFVILKIGRATPGEEKILLTSTEVEDFVEEYLKLRKGIQVGEMHTSLPHNIGVPPTPFALVLTYDDLDKARKQMAILVRIDKKKIDPSILFRPYDMDNKRWANEIQKLKEEMADKLSPQIIRSYRQYSPMGMSESEEKIPAEVQAEMERKQKEAEKV